ncbi:MAG: acetyltransferase [Alphaproteobacteria bacterium]|nr:MAG: acetyltransferase [Alphaproteobacteria bacterium]
MPNDESHTTFIALSDEQIVGTITLGVDAPGGLAVDAVFKDEIDRFRAAPGAQVCELIKFAFETELPDQQNLAMLFHAVFLYGLQNHRCTDLFIEVNPRHRRFYQSMLGFTPIGDMRTNPSVDAPSQLMWLNVSDVADSIASYRSDVGATRTRSLYSLFLSQTEESVIKTRLEERKRSNSQRGRNLIERSLPSAGVGIAR